MNPSPRCSEDGPRTTRRRCRRPPYRVHFPTPSCRTQLAGKCARWGKSGPPFSFCSPIPDNWGFLGVAHASHARRDMPNDGLACHWPRDVVQLGRHYGGRKLPHPDTGQGKGAGAQAPATQKGLKNGSRVSHTQPLLAGVCVFARPGWWRLSPSRTKKPPGGCRARQPRDRSEYVGVLGNAVYRTGPRRRHLWLV